MSDREIYPYAFGDRFNQRNTYFYSAFHGLDFLKAWKSTRTNITDNLSTKIPSDPPVGSGSSILPGKSEALLNHLYSACSGGSINPDDTVLLDRFIQKFEVTKRVHGGYDERFRAINKEDHNDLMPYLRLAEVLEAAYSFHQRLPQLNAFLKIMDTICAMSSLLAPTDHGRLIRLIVREELHLITIATERGVTL